MNQHLAGGGVTAALTTLVIYLLSLAGVTLNSTQAGGLIVAAGTFAVWALRRLHPPTPKA